MSETVKFGYGERRLAVEYVKDVSEDVPLLESPDGVLRAPDGRGWKIWHDESGVPCVTEYTASECERLAEQAAIADASRAAEENALREQSRAARDLRDLAPASIRAPR